MQLVEWRAPTWARRPAGLVAHTRWLFCVTVLLALVLTLPAPLSAGDGVPVALLAVSSALVLGAAWVLQYQQRGPALVLDAAQVVATLVFAAACPAPSAAFGFTFSMLWMRALYGSTTRVVLYCALLAAAIASSVRVWPLVPGHAGAIPGGPVLAAMPAFFLTVTVARHLALALFAREQSRDRDAALVELSARLLGITDRDTIYALARQAAHRICQASPGLRVAVVRADRDRDQLQVLRTAGPFVTVPEVLRSSVVLGGADGTGVWPAQDTESLDDAAGTNGHWVCLALPEQPGLTMLLGAPGGVTADALVAVQSMANQVALALRTCDAHQDLALQAQTDSLTGLANRAAFTQALELALVGHPLPTVLFVDLDDFKTVNDGLGHVAGDELLRHIADRLRSIVRPQDLCARLGGDEFAVLLPGETPEVAYAVAQRLVELVAEPVMLRQGRAPVGASVGVAAALASMSAEQLMQRADAAMYAAKAQGKNRVRVFDPTLLQLDQQQVLEADLAAAVDAGQLVVHYQPVVSAQDGRCTAVEALVRWQHPVRGLLAPAEFVWVAERTGAIVEIGAAVLREACAFVAGQRDDPARRDDQAVLAVHVNVSARQLLDAGFVEVVRDCLRRCSLADKQLVLEVTESMVLDSPKARATLFELVSLGVALAIDDFGTGYSALTTLRTLPLDIVKIDRSFVGECTTNRADHAVVEAIVQMADRLGLRTIAEGVERLDQQQFLQRAGIGATQGFLHCRPMPAAAASAWLAAETRRTAMDTNVITLAARRSS